MSEPQVAVVVTLVHGTWAKSAPWTNPNSPLATTLNEALKGAGGEVEIRAHRWSGTNRVRARRDAARALADRLQQDLLSQPGALHLLVGHSHGGNVALDAVRQASSQGQDRIMGIATLSTPFVEASPSRIWLLGEVILAPILIWLCLLLYYLLFSAAEWVWISVGAWWPVVRWSLRIGVFLLAMGWGLQLGRMPFDLIGLTHRFVTDIAQARQDRILARFKPALERPVPLLAVRFGLDEALWSLLIARVLVRPARALTLSASTLTAFGGAVLLSSGLLTIAAALLDSLFRTSFLDPVQAVVVVAAALLIPGFWLTVSLFITWMLLSYGMRALTLGDWGGIGSQLLVDFQIAAAPGGGWATTKRYSPLRLRFSLRHGLTHDDPEVLADVSNWVAAQVSSAAVTANDG